MLPNEGGELRVVANPVEEEVKEDGFASRASRPHGAGRKLDCFVPIHFRVEKLAEERKGTIMGGVDRFDGIVGNVGVVGRGLVCEAFGKAELYGYDVLEELSYGLDSHDVAWDGKKFRMAGLEGCAIR